MIDQNQQARVLELTTDFTAKREGFSNVVYKDSGGVATFGYGSLLKYHPNQTFPISTDDARALLRAEMVPCIQCLVNNILVPITDAQATALGDFIYNEGRTSFTGSTLLKLINFTAPQAAICREFMKWVYDDGEVVQGLVNRRQAEIDLYTS